jgi:D-sedoheptulose 7-phosphate isomerase
VNRVEDLFARHPDGPGYARGYLDYLTEVLAALDAGEIAAFADALMDARERGARIFFIGNGGSAATASHFVNDLTKTPTPDRPFRALSLTENVALLTALANDYGYEHVFRHQLETLMGAGDVVVAISASGNSPNIVSAIDYANAHGATTIGLTGFDGGRLRQIADVCVHAPTNHGEYGPAEDVHMILDHLVTSYLLFVCTAAARA